MGWNQWADDDALPEEEEAEERFSYLKEVLVLKCFMYAAWTFR